MAKQQTKDGSEVLEFIRTTILRERSDGYIAVLIPVDEFTVGKSGDPFHILRDKENSRYIVQHAGTIAPREIFTGGERSE